MRSIVHSLLTPGITTARHSSAGRILSFSILWLMLFPCIVDGAEREQDSFEIGGIYFR